MYESFYCSILPNKALKNISTAIQNLVIVFKILLFQVDKKQLKHFLGKKKLSAMWAK